ncbi:hypothetical protein MXMO3_01839 [Maritalea myrionectae]|uniref:Uncharacterized protein n=1 Tax=Maritalea myrionectae TaxID=454601 RepID=A0A2R4MEM0_9HYPH|nr:hypothetical protein [Maritalea myrionectae]AVX04364.1 hypothetical protein MXMO3_01839 [Maritalea myrionectae]
MPVAIAVLPDGVIPAIYSEKTNDALLSRLRTIKDAPDLKNVAEAQSWLATLQEPSGWFANAELARLYTSRMREEVQFSGPIIVEAREALGEEGKPVSRARFGAMIGIGGKDNTRHKTVFDAEREKIKLSKQASRQMLSVLAEKQLLKVLEG